MSETTVREVDDQLPEVRTEDESITPSQLAGVPACRPRASVRTALSSDETPERLCVAGTRRSVHCAARSGSDRNFPMSALYMWRVSVVALRLIGKQARGRAVWRVPGSLRLRRTKRLDALVMAVNSGIARPIRAKLSNVAALPSV